MWRTAKYGRSPPSSPASWASARTPNSECTDRSPASRYSTSSNPRNVPTVWSSGPVAEHHVAYPAADSRSATVGIDSERRVPRRPRTPWAVGYRPVNIDVNAGVVVGQVE